MNVYLINAAKQVLGDKDFTLINGVVHFENTLDFEMADQETLDKIESKRIELENRGQVPQSVLMAQARIILKKVGLFDSIEKAINDMPEGDQKTAAQQGWEYAPNISRTGAFVTSMAPLLGLDENTLDTLFIEASKIKL